MKAEWVGLEFGILMAFYPGQTYSWYWERLDPWFQIPWEDIRDGWRMVCKEMVEGSGVRYRLA